MYDPAPMMTPKPFSEVFKELREQLGLTQLQAANLLGMTPTQVWRWEHGESEPRPLTQDGILAKLRAELKKASRKRPTG